jgi:hypothetical protein
MHRLITILFVLVSLFVSTSAYAEIGSQMIVSARGNAVVSEKLTIGVHGAVFMAPQMKPIGFLYVGPGFQITDWWWTSPRVGVAHNWFASVPAPIVSSWNLFSAGDFSVFTETEIYISAQQVDFYGLYMIDYSIGDLSVGLQGEQVNLGIKVGPHVGLAIGKHLSVNTQYYWDFMDGHTLRLVLSAKIN